jgi:hypothetical protein
MLRRLVLLSFLAPVALLDACGAGDVSPPPLLAPEGGTSEGGVDSGGTDAPATFVNQKGVVKTLNLNTPVANAKVTCGTQSTTTDATGKYAIKVDPSTPFNMRIELTGTTPATNFYTLTEQLTQVKADIDLAKTSFLREDTANILLATLDGYDPSGGVVSVSVQNKGCASEQGATLDFTVGGQPVPGASLFYVSGTAPDKSLTSVQADAFPSAVIFNLPANKDVTVTVKHPTCKMVPFPVDVDLTLPQPGGGGQGSGTLTYISSTITSLPGKATSFLRVYLQ